MINLKLPKRDFRVIKSQARTHDIERRQRKVVLGQDKLNIEWLKIYT